MGRTMRFFFIPPFVNFAVHQYKKLCLIQSAPQIDNPENAKKVDIKNTSNNIF